MSRPFLLVNTNVARPPVSPVGLEYLGEALVEAGIQVQVLDLAFEADWKKVLAGSLKDSEPVAVGVSVRNTDDSSFVTRKSFLPWISEVVSEIRRLTGAFIILGGVGFSVMPETILRFTGADAGVAGDSEEVAPALVRCLANSEDFSYLPNMVYRRNGSIVSNPRVSVNSKYLPLPRRRLFDNHRYEELGAMVGIETKRGCPRKCIFCADPVAKGSIIRERPPAIVVREFADLLDQGVSWFHLCDSEFNMPLAHAGDVCRAIIGAGLGDKIRWYGYCSPTPFDRELADLMKRAGCAGINFGVDSLCDEQLSRLGRSHTVDDIRGLVQILGKTGLNYIFDFLIGAPGETRQTVKITFDRIKKLNIPLAGIACGIRTYPGTCLGEAISDGSIREGLFPGKEYHEPLYYLSPRLGEDAPALVEELAGGDRRFLFLGAPSGQESYNYAGDEMLVNLIKAGARGAYWDIINQSRGR